MSQSTYDIVIIGAGLAGLAAGQRLRQAGVAPLVLEARERLGGRIWTDHTHGPVELGAEFIHGEKASIWELIKSCRIKTESWPQKKGLNTKRLYAWSGQLVTDPPDFSGRVEQLYKLAETYNGPERSAAEFIEQQTDWDDLAARFVRRRLENVEAANVTHLSVQALAYERTVATAGWENFRVAGGYDKLVTFLAEGLDIRLQAAVHQIKWNSAGATVMLADGESLQARHLIVTVPLSLLQAGLPMFQPALPARKRDAIHRLAMGSVTKLALWFDEVFWEPFAFLNTNGLVTTWWPVYTRKTPVLMGYTGGPTSLLLGALGEARAIHQGLSELAGFYGDIVRQRYVAGRMVDWAREPWTRGSYSYTPVGAGDARADLATPVEWTLFFAGEATHTQGHLATTHGAIETGRRAAAEILAL